MKGNCIMANRFPRTENYRFMNHGKNHASREAKNAPLCVTKKNYHLRGLFIHQSQNQLDPPWLQKWFKQQSFYFFKSFNAIFTLERLLLMFAIFNQRYCIVCFCTENHTRLAWLHRGISEGLGLIINVERSSGRVLLLPAMGMEAPVDNCNCSSNYGKTDANYNDNTNWFFKKTWFFIICKFKGKVKKVIKIWKFVNIKFWLTTPAYYYALPCFSKGINWFV